MPKIVIEIEKYLDKDQYNRPFVLVKKVYALKKEELPESYCGSSPQCYLEPAPISYETLKPMNIPRLAVYKAHNKYAFFDEGGRYEKVYFEKWLEVIKNCAAKLRGIKSRLSSEAEFNAHHYANWVGEEKIEI